MAYVSVLVLGLASAASVSYIMFAITRTLTGVALAGFTIIVMPLGEAGGWAEPRGWREAAVKGEAKPIWPLLTVFLSLASALGPELEWLDVRHRTVAGVLSSTFWTGGMMLLALVGYLIRDWRWLLLAVTLPCALGIISLW